MSNTTRRERLAAAGLLALAAAVMVRSLFVGLEIDEEYALSLGFRLVSGDRLFYSMWEPHQLSALPAAALVGLFIALTGGTTGVVLFARGAVLLCKAAMSWVFYREFAPAFGRRASFLAALALFLYTPKWFLGPDYISQQFHFSVAAFLCLHHYVTRGFRRPWLAVLGAVCACLSYLAFPQSIPGAAFTFAGLAVLGRRGGEPAFCRLPRGAWLFALGCAGCGLAFLAWVLPGMGLPLLLERVALILNDPQYGFSAAERLALLAGQAWSIAKFLAKPLLPAVLLALLRKRRRPDADAAADAWGLFALFSILWCLVYAVALSEIDLRWFYPVVAAAGGLAFRGGRGTAREPLLWLGFLPGIAAYLFILRSTLLGLGPTFMYLCWPALCGLLALAHRERAPRAWPAGSACLGALIAFLAVVRLWCVLLTGWPAANIRNTALRRIESGPAKGVWADGEMADMQEALAEALAPYAGQRLLQAIGLQHGCGFLMDEGTLTVGQASVISGTDSDPRLIQYYEALPEKRPDVILYDENEVRDMEAFHAWIEESLPITGRYEVVHGTARLWVLTVGQDG